MLNATNTSAKRPSTATSAKSPIVTSMASPPDLARRRATIASDASMPCTGTPRSASGRATRPVPIASSSTGPPAASSVRVATAFSASSVDGWMSS